MTIALRDQRSYISKANLLKALNKLGIADFNPIIVKNEDNRWTAIFRLHKLDNTPLQGNCVAIPTMGFLLIN